jgi:hypothetical protein
MAIVPIYEQKQTLRPTHQQAVTSKAVPTDFGEQTGKAMKAFGEGIGSLATSIGKVEEARLEAAQKVETAEAGQAAQKALQAKNQETMVKQADHRFATALRDGVHNPETGYLATRGEAAIADWSAFDARTDEMLATYGAGLTGWASDEYRRLAETRRAMALRTGLAHRGNQTKAWHNEQSLNRQDDFVLDAVANYNDEQVVMTNLAAGLNEVENFGAESGWSAEQTAEAKAKYSSSGLSKVVERLLVSDPFEAERFLEKHKTLFWPDHLKTIEGFVKDEVAVKKAERLGDEIIEKSRNPLLFDPANKYLIVPSAYSVPDLPEDSKLPSGSLKDGAKTGREPLPQDGQQSTPPVDAVNSNDLPATELQNPGEQAINTPDDVEIVKPARQDAKAPSVDVVENRSSGPLKDDVKTSRELLPQDGSKSTTPVDGVSNDPTATEPQKPGEQAVNTPNDGDVAKPAQQGAGIPNVGLAERRISGPRLIGGGDLTLEMVRKQEASAPKYNYLPRSFKIDTVTRADGRVDYKSSGTPYSFDDVERDLTRRVRIIQDKIQEDVGPAKWQRLRPEGQAALTSLAYEYGGLPEHVSDAVQSGDEQTIALAVQELVADGGGINQSRRKQEIALINGTDDGGKELREVASRNFKAEELRKVENPRDRQLTGDHIERREAEYSKKSKAEQNEAVDVIYDTINKGGSIRDVPIDVCLKAGSNAVERAQEYERQLAKGGEPKTDEVLWDELISKAHVDPAAFREISLREEFSGRLSPSKLQELVSIQQQSVADLDKARRTGQVYNDAYYEAAIELSAVGMDMALVQGTPSTESYQDMARKIADFKSALRLSIDQFIGEKGREPWSTEREAMIKELLMPVTFKRWFGLWTEPGRLYEAKFDEGDRDVELSPKYSDIPLGFREEKEQEFYKSKGYKMTKEKVVEEYIESRSKVAGKDNSEGKAEVNSK